MRSNKPNRIIVRNKEIMGGTPVFSGTRVPIQTLWDYLLGGDSVDEFLKDFPSVSRQQALELMERARRKVSPVP